MDLSQNAEADSFILEELIKNCLTTSNNVDAIREAMPDAADDLVSATVSKLKTESPYSFFHGEIPQPSDNTSSNHLQNYVLSMLEVGDAPDSSLSLFSSPAESSTKFASISATKNRHSKKSHGSRRQQEFGANMVIHVCDEGKKLTQDFTCPRNLLVREMKYFAEYLSLDSQRLEEVDISVHCDIHIFDWLMRYVKRSTNLIKETDIPQLEANNVVSILISSDFLRMESLVTECILFCHENMSAILSTPCNMNCINDQLCSRIAKCFTHNQLEEVKDRKDKFKSKLFCKKIEQLFDENPSSPNALALFKCSQCQRIMTKRQSCKLACNNPNLKISVDGKLTYHHQVDNSWDINSWIVSLYEELRQWSKVYWRLWATINHLTCSTCNSNFQLFEFGHCKYHRDKPQFTSFANHAVSDMVIGSYPCCNQNVLRFDPTEMNKGCCVREHTVAVSDEKERQLLDDLMLHGDSVKVEYNPTDSDHISLVNIFSSEEKSCCIEDATVTHINTGQRIIAPNINNSSSHVKRNNVYEKEKFLRVANVGFEEDDEESEDEELSNKSRIPLTKARNQMTSRFSQMELKSSKKKSKVANDSTTYRKYPIKHQWDSTRTTRYNQDIQREEDRRRMNALSNFLSKQNNDRGMEKNKASQAKELQGGIFIKLEVAFLSSLKSHAGAVHDKRSLQNSNLNNGKDFRHKYRSR